MPLHKNRPLARRSCSSNSSQPASGTGSRSPATTDKSSQAAFMAQHLASQNSWADTYAPSTPATVATPAESVADAQSQVDDSEPPPSYEDARLQRELPSIPQSRHENVRSVPSATREVPSLDPSGDVEAGTRTPLLFQNQDVVKSKAQKQRRFIIVFIILAVWLMGIQAIKGFGIGFWRADGTPMPPLPQRNYTQHETSSPISGTFTFYDELDLSTFSGSINIVIDPQPSDKVGIIRLSSRSGSIKVKFTDDYIKGVTASGVLDRVYDIEITSASGSQNVELPQGNGGITSLTADSGSIAAKLYTAHLGRTKAVTKLSTQTSSGTQSIKIKSTSSEPITSLAATHWAKGSATIKVNLPPVWEGMVHASVGGSGGVDVKGDNLQYQRNGNKEIFAWRGHGDNSDDQKKFGQVVEVRGDGSGSIKVDCSST